MWSLQNDTSCVLRCTQSTYKFRTQALLKIMDKAVEAIINCTIVDYKENKNKKKKKSILSAEIEILINNQIL